MRAILVLLLLLLPLTLAAGEDQRVSRERLLTLPAEKSWKLPAEPGVRYRLRGRTPESERRLRPGSRGFEYEVIVERDGRPNLRLKTSGPLHGKGVGVDFTVRY
jgi:hypothetical protein